MARLKTASIARALALSILSAPLLVWAATFLVPLPEDGLKTGLGTTDVLDRNGEILARIASDEARLHRPLKIDEMGEVFPAVIMAVEDHRFREHQGVDLHALAGAVLRNLKNGRIVSGASTISQQTIKLATGRTRRSWTGKVYEMLAAIRLERRWTKDEILEYYVNHISFGNRLVGIEAASQVYFGKSARELDLNEAVFLAGLPQAPSRYNPWSRKSAADARYLRCLARLDAAEFLTDGKTARDLVPPEVNRHGLPWKGRHVVDMVRPWDRAKGGDIRTTVDWDLQERTETIVAPILTELKKFNVSHSAVVIIANKTGAVRTLVGSGDFDGREGQINGALVHRSAGSALKPFVYGFAMDQDLLTAASLLPDTPDALRKRYPNYNPKNFDGRYWGPVRVREALGASLNVPAVVVGSRVGPRQVFTMLEECGIRFRYDFERYGAGIVLGNGGIRLMDLASAFTSIPNGGVMVDHRLHESTQPKYRRIFSEETAFILGDILSDSKARLKTFGTNSPLDTSARLPCKTGTSSSFMDAWTVGSTAQHTVGVWMGNFSGTPMRGVTSVTGPARIWREICEMLIRQGDGEVPLAPPAGLEQVQVCALSGLNPCRFSEETYLEWFRTDNAPTETAERFYEQSPDGRVGITLSNEYSVWCRSNFNWLDARVSNGERRLAIHSPAEDERFCIVDYLPSSQQMLRLWGEGIANEELRWYVDEQEISPRNGIYFWSLKKGEHVVKLVEGDHHASHSFSVE